MKNLAILNTMAKWQCVVSKSQYCLILLLCCLFLPIQSHASERYPFETPAKQAQFNHLLKNLRCLVCQNQDLADSNAPLANDLREEVYQLVERGQSDDEVMRFLTERYGDFIRFKPPIKATTLVLWYAPLLFILLGGLMVWRSCFKRVVNE